MTRQPRTKRKAGVAVKVTARDRGLLRALLRFRIARSSDLIRYGFPNARRDGGQRRLRKLFDAGLIAVRSRRLNDENLYSLTRKGCQELKVLVSARGRIPKQGVGHHLAVVATWTDIALGVEKRSPLRLDVFQPEWVIRERLGRGHGQPVVPDALVQLSLPMPNGERQTTWLALEVDLATEHLPALERKLRAYDKLRQPDAGLFGLTDFILATYARGASDRRIARLRALFASRFAGAWWLWRTAAELEANLDRLAPPLTKSPNGKGSCPSSTLNQKETSRRGDSGKASHPNDVRLGGA